MARKKKEFNEAVAIKEAKEHFSMYYEASWGRQIANGEAFSILYYPDLEIFSFKDETDPRNKIMKETFAYGYFNNVIMSKKFQKNLLKHCESLHPTNPLRSKLMAQMYKNCYEEWVKYLSENE